MNKPLYNISIMRDKSGKASIQFPEINAKIDIDESFSTYSIDFERRLLCFFREGKFKFNSVSLSLSETVCKVFSFSGKLLYQINFPEIDKTIPENKYDLSYRYSTFVDEGIHFVFRSSVWQIGEFQSTYSFNELEYGIHNPSR